jgi:LmbE family N-acetylglucosaminyl deacetylase
VQGLAILVVGAHPDDVEIGAGGLIVRLLEDGCDVRILVLTDDPVSGEIRRQEATEAAEALGVPAARVYFARFRDGELVANRETVGALRKLMSSTGFSPEVIISHSRADSHNDHVQANALLHATFRRATFLGFSIHISAESSRFAPRFFSRLDDRLGRTKAAALACHRSQERQIHGKSNLEEYERRLGELATIDRAEAFEVEQQVDASDPWEWLLRFNDSPFHRLWLPIIGGSELWQFYEAFTGQPNSIAEWSTDHESRSRDMLRDAFNDKWIPTTPLHERTSNTPEAVRQIASSHVMLVGGPVNNPLTRDTLNRFNEVRWIIEYGMPDREPVFLLDKATGERHFPEMRGGKLRRDLAVLSLLESPFNPTKYIIACAGITGAGTAGMVRFLANPASSPDLSALVQAFVNSRKKVLQVPMLVNVKNNHLERYGVPWIDGTESDD